MPHSGHQHTISDIYSDHDATSNPRIMHPALRNKRALYVGDAYAEDPKAGYILGIMHLRDLISDAQYNAALEAAQLIIFRLRVLGVELPMPRGVRYDPDLPFRTVEDYDDNSIYRNKRMYETLLYGIKKCADWQRGYKHFHEVVLMDNDPANLPWLPTIASPDHRTHHAEDWNAFYEVLDLCVQFFGGGKG